MGAFRRLKGPLLLMSIATALQHANASRVKRQEEPHTTAPPGSGVSITAVSECHLHSATQYCLHEGTEYLVLAPATATEDLPSSYTGCHAHAAETWCMSPNGGEVEIALEAEASPAPTAAPEEDHDDHDHAEDEGVKSITSCHLDGSSIACLHGTTEYNVVGTPTGSSIPAQYTDCHAHDAEMFCVDPSGADVAVHVAGEEHAPGVNCHFHAGVEHCVGGDESAPKNCGRRERDYNIKLRVGLLFVILATSAIGVFGPIFLQMILPPKAYSVLLIFKQFGTGVIISTAFVHLYTHATLMFNNECLEGVNYEGTTSAILMAGIFLSFIVEYAGQRLVHARHVRMLAASNDHSTATLVGEMKVSNEIVSVLVLEAGIIFHSLLIGLTLVVAGDSYFLQLFAVILFHQMFEGIALGTRIAALGTASPNKVPHGHLHSHSHSHSLQRISRTHSHVHEGEGHHAHDHPTTPQQTDEQTSSEEEDIKPVTVSLKKKLAFASIFALVTPVGMAIGIGVLGVFNGNDPSTLIAIGTLDALSAGILVWVGIVEMWAEDWMFGGEMTYAGPLTTVLGGTGLILGMAIMSLLGKWA